MTGQSQPRIARIPSFYFGPPFLAALVQSQRGPVLVLSPAANNESPGPLDGAAFPQVG